MRSDDTFWSHSTAKLDNFLVIFGGLQHDDDDLLLTRVIRMYNLHTEEWRQQVIPQHEIVKNGAPGPFLEAVAVAINGTIYTFGGTGYGKNANSTIDRNALWTLSKGKTGYFTWNLIKGQHDNASPSPRTGHTGWEYAGKLWVFGGGGPSPEHYLNDHGDIAGDDDCAMNNQLLCYNPKIQKWTNPQCSGDVPSPRAHHASTSIKNKVWIFGGFNENWTVNDDIFELTMNSLTWTQIRTVQPRPQARQWCTLTALPNNQLVLHGGDNMQNNYSPPLSDTWIMDLTSYSWRPYNSRKDHPRRSHTASVCLNNNVIIIGGSQQDYDCQPYNSVFHVMLETQSLQQLAAQTIYKHQNEINWNCLPKKLISLLGLSGPPEPVRHVFVKRISKDTKDLELLTMIEQNGFTIKELKRVAHAEAQFKSYKLAVPCSEFNKLFNENLWPNGVLVRTYWPQKPGSK